MDGNVADFRLAKQLALTPSRVQNFRTKYALRNKSERGWLDTVTSVLENDTYDLCDVNSSRGWEIRIMLPSKMDVYEFQDALASNGIYFDGRFNNQIVCVPIASFTSLLLAKTVESTTIANNLECNNESQFLFKSGLEADSDEKSIDEIIRKINAEIGVQKGKDHLARIIDSSIGSLIGGLASGALASLFNVLSVGVKKVIEKQLYSEENDLKVMNHIRLAFKKLGEKAQKLE